MVGHYAHNGNRSLVYLHFVGELLRSASCAGNDWTPSQEWFLSALQMFEGLTLHDGLETPVSAVQLTLFERKEPYDADS